MHMSHIIFCALFALPEWVMVLGFSLYILTTPLDNVMQLFLSIAFLVHIHPSTLDII